MPGLPLPLAPRAGGTVTSPTYISKADSPDVFNSTSPKTTAGINALTGDVLVAYAFSGDSTNTVTLSDSLGLTWTQPQTPMAVTGYAWLGVWVTVLAAPVTGLTVSFARTGSTTFGGNVAIVRGSSGVGGSGKTNNNTGTPSLTFTTLADNSLVFVFNNDFNGLDGATRAWVTSAGAFTETCYSFNASETAYGGYHANVGVAGSKTVGLTAPAGQVWGTIAVELKGIVSGGTTFNQTLTATAGITVLRTLRANPVRSVSQGSTATNARSSVKSLLASVGSSTAMTRLTGKLLPITQGSTVTVTKASIFQKTISAVATTAALILKRPGIVRDTTQASTTTNPRSISATRTAVDPISLVINKVDRTTIQTTQGVGPVVSKQAQLPRSSTVGSTASLLRRAGKVTTIVQTMSVGSPQRAVGKLVMATSTIILVVSAARTYLLSLLAAQSSSTSALKRANTTQLIAQGSSSTATRRAGATRVAGQGTSVAVPRLVSRFVVATQSTSASIVARNVVLRVLSVAVGSVATVAKRAGANRLAAQATATTANLRTGKVSAAALATSVTVARRASRSFLATQASTATITIQNVVLRTLTVAVGTAASVAKRVNMIRSATSALVTSRSVGAARAITAQQATTAAAIKQARVSKSATSTASASLISSFTRNLVLLAAQGTSASIRRVISRGLMVSQPTIPSVRRTIAKTLGVAVGVVSTITTPRRVVLVLAVQVGSIASIVRQKIIHVTDFVTRGSTRVDGRRRRSEVLGRPYNSRVRSIRKR